VRRVRAIYQRMVRRYVYVVSAGDDA